MSITHTTMIGATLAPLSALVAHVAQHEAVHPAVSMCTKDERIVSVISSSVIRKVRINASNTWLRDVLNFKPTQERPQRGKNQGSLGQATNDFAIVTIKQGTRLEQPNLIGLFCQKSAFLLAGLATGSLLAAGACLGILSDDLWALVLFATFFAHWFVSTWISCTHMVEPTCPEIRQDSRIRYLIHERPAGIGGTVIFKGTQFDLETWARTTLSFRSGRAVSGLHWLWILTGALSAVASIACMVNMSGVFQLGFLGVLVYSSLVELGLTRVARVMQELAQESSGNETAFALRDNTTRTLAVIRATLGVPPEFALDGLDWVAMKLLPCLPIFKHLQTLLHEILHHERREAAGAVLLFRYRCEQLGLGPDDRKLVDRIVREIQDTVEKSQA